MYRYKCRRQPKTKSRTEDNCVDFRDLFGLVEKSEKMNSLSLYTRRSTLRRHSGNSYYMSESQSICEDYVRERRRFQTETPMDWVVPLYG